LTKPNIQANRTTMSCQ